MTPASCSNFKFNIVPGQLLAFMDIAQSHGVAELLVCRFWGCQVSVLTLPLHGDGCCVSKSACPQDCE